MVFRYTSTPMVHLVFVAFLVLCDLISAAAVCVVNI